MSKKKQSDYIVRFFLPNIPFFEPNVFKEDFLPLKCCFMHDEGYPRDDIVKC